MSIPFHLLAELPAGDALPPSNSSGPWLNPQTRDLVVIATAVLLVTAVCVVVIFISLRRRHKMPNSKPPATGNGQSPKYFRSRGSNPADEPTTRNPTLAEKGGLPPIREKSNGTPS